MIEYPKSYRCFFLEKFRCCHVILMTYMEYRQVKLVGNGSSAPYNPQNVYAHSKWESRVMKCIYLVQLSKKTD